MADLQEAREILRHWFSYGPTSYGYGPTPIPVDEMSDDEIVAVIEAIRDQPDERSTR